MRRLCVLILGVVVCATLAAPVPATADVLWSWRFASEAGTFVTDGTMADTAGPYNFTIIRNFEVTASAYPVMVGATYHEHQPPQGMRWNGSAPTEFWRAGGTYTNGSCFFNASNEWWYGLGPPPLAGLLDEGETVVIEDTLTVAPLGAAQAVGIPVAGWASLAVLGCLVALAGIILLRPV